MREILLNRKNNYTVLLIIFVLGIVHWVLFMSYGNPSYNSFDWRTSHQLYAVIKESIEIFKIPYYVTLYGSDTLTESVRDIKFLSWADIKSVSPQLLLMKFMSVPSFIIFNSLLFFSVGYWAVVKWIKELKLSNTAAAYLTIMWCFNGYLTSKMGIGWLGTNFGYFIIPNFLWIVYKFINKDKYTARENIILILEFAFLMFFTILNGSGKCLYQFGLVSLLVMIWYPRRLPTYFMSMFITFILASFWFWPGMLFSEYSGMSREVWAGYGFGWREWQPSLYLDGGPISFVINTLLNIFQHLWTSATVIYSAGFEGQWEFNIYVGYLGISLLIATLFLFIREHRTIIAVKKNKSVYISLLLSISFILSLSIISVLYHKLPRFTSLGLVIVFIIGIILIYYYIKTQNEFQETSNRMILIIIPLLLVSFLSIYTFKAYIFKFLQVLYYFPAFDRTPGKLFGYVLYTLILLSATQFDRLFSSFPKKFVLPFKWFIIIILFSNLMLNSFKWSVYNTESHFNPIETWNKLGSNYPHNWQDPRGVYDVKIYDMQEDNNYKQIVNTSYLVSGIAFIVTFILYLFARYRPKLIKLE